MTAPIGTYRYIGFLHGGREYISRSFPSLEECNTEALSHQDSFIELEVVAVVL